jgi:tRNA U55 pseudouridine synthase TruB
LTRTQSGQFSLQNAVTLDTLADSPQWTDFLIQPYDALQGFATILVSEAEAREFGFGRAIATDAPPVDTCMVYLSDHTLVAIAKIEDHLLKPQKVFVHDATG